MSEFQCKECGAVYTSESTEFPSEIVCICRGRNFKLIEKEL